MEHRTAKSSNRDLSMEAPGIQRFLDSQDLAELVEPVEFPRDDAKFGWFYCVGTWGGLVESFCLNCCIAPLALWCPGSLSRQHHLLLDSEQVTWQVVENDFCCHVAHHSRSVELQRIHDLVTDDDCCLSCFGLKALRVYTGPKTRGTPEIEALHLADAEQAKFVIALAASQRRNGARNYAMPVMMAPPDGPMAAGVAERLERMECLVDDGVLTEKEAADIKPSVLASLTDPLGLLFEAQGLRDAGALNQDEFQQMKEKVLLAILYC